MDVIFSIAVYDCDTKYLFWMESTYYKAVVFSC
jgi:hypothetical protein